MIDGDRHRRAADGVKQQEKRRRITAAGDRDRQPVGGQGREARRGVGRRLDGGDARAAGEGVGVAGIDHEGAGFSALQAAVLN